MITNADLTIYNYWENSGTKAKEYRRTQIEGIHWYTDQKVNATDKGLVSADLYKIRIPNHAKVQEGRTYIDAKKYHMLDATRVDNHWTVDHNDIVVKGLVDEDITSLSSLNDYSEAVRIRSFSVNNYGSSPHIRIGGVA